MANSYPLKIGTKLGDAAASDYQPDGRVYPGHLTGRQDRTRKSHFERRRLAASDIPFGSGEVAGKQTGGHFGWVMVRDGDVWRVTMLTANLSLPK
jgi:hypothetical protein